MAGTPSIITLPGDRRRFIAGMHWVTSDRRPTRSEIKKVAAHEGTWVADRRGRSVNQTGYCHPIPGLKLKRGIYSIAAMVADSRKEPWQCVFELGEDLYWFIAVRDNNAILPDGDLIGTYDEVNDARERAASLDWDDTFLNADASSLRELLAKAQTVVPVADIEKHPLAKPLLTGAVVIGTATAGVMAWDRHEAHLRMLRAREIAHARAVAAAMQRQHETRTVLPWTRLASPAATFRGCKAELDRVPISQYGWIPSSKTCHMTGAHLSVRIKWVPGPGATTAKIPQGSLSHDATSVYEVLSPVVLKRDNRSRLLGNQGATQALYAVTGPLGIHTSTSNAHPKRASGLPGKPGHRKSALVSPWQRLSVSMRTHLPVIALTGLGSQLAAIPGFRLTSISWEGKQGWRLSGVLFIQRGSGHARESR